MTDEAFGALLAAARPEHRAGFCAELVLAAGPTAPLSASVLEGLELFQELAGLSPEQGVAERQQRVDRFFARWPLPVALSGELESRARKLSVCDFTADALVKTSPPTQVQDGCAAVASRTVDPAELFGFSRK